jgi:hypothetical protein
MNTPAIRERIPIIANAHHGHGQRNAAANIVANIATNPIRNAPRLARMMMSPSYNEKKGARRNNSM